MQLTSQTFIYDYIIRCDCRLCIVVSQRQFLAHNLQLGEEWEEERLPPPCVRVGSLKGSGCKHNPCLLRPPLHHHTRAASYTDRCIIDTRSRRYHICMPVTGHPFIDPAYIINALKHHNARMICNGYILWQCILQAHIHYSLLIHHNTCMIYTMYVRYATLLYSSQATQVYGIRAMYVTLHILYPYTKNN